MKAARVVVVALAAFFCQSAFAVQGTANPYFTASPNPGTASAYYSWDEIAKARNGHGMESQWCNAGGTTCYINAVQSGSIGNSGQIYAKYCYASGGQCTSTWWSPTSTADKIAVTRVNASATVECPADYVVDGAGACAPPPELDCGREAGKVVRAKLASANAQNWCFETGQTIDPDSDISNDNFVTGSCQGVVDPSGTLITDLATGELIGSFKLTGQPCSDPNPDVPEPTVEEPEAPDEVCVTGSSGTKACVSKDNPANCGEFNGQKICVDSPPPGNCTFFGGGNWVCDSNAPTPPAPADPPGSTTPAQPEFSQSGRGQTGQPSTVNIYPPGVEGGDSGSTYTPPDTGDGVGDGEGGGSCGGEGQPPCKVDEDGTPTFEDGEISDATGALDGTLSDAEGAGDSAPFGDGSTVASGARSGITGALPAGGDCGPIVWTLPFGNEVTIDLYDKCGPFRDAMAWVLGLFTAWYLIQLAFRAPVGG